MRVTFDERPTIMPDSYCEDEHDAREGSYIPPLEVVSEPPLGTAGPPPRPVAKVEPLVSVDTVRKASGGAAQVSRDPNLVDIDMNWKPEPPPRSKKQSSIVDKYLPGAGASARQSETKQEVDLISFDPPSTSLWSSLGTNDNVKLPFSSTDLSGLSLFDNPPPTELKSHTSAKFDKPPLMDSGIVSLSSSTHSVAVPSASTGAVAKHTKNLKED